MKKHIFHCTARKGFVKVSNATAREKSLSLRARGLLVFVLSNASNWVITQQRLIAQCSEGAGAVRTALLELERAGYAVFSLDRCKGGKFANQVWKFHDRPVAENERSSPADRRAKKRSNLPKFKAKKEASPVSSKSVAAKSPTKKIIATEDHRATKGAKGFFTIPRIEKREAPSKATRSDRRGTPEAPLNPPTFDEYERFVQNPKFATLLRDRPIFWNEMDRNGWRLQSGEIIYDWKAYTISVQRKIKQARTRSVKYFSRARPIVNSAAFEAAAQFVEEYNPVPE